MEEVLSVTMPVKLVSGISTKTNSRYYALEIKVSDVTTIRHFLTSAEAEVILKNYSK